MKKFLLFCLLMAFVLAGAGRTSAEEYDPINTLLALNMAVVSVNSIVTTQDRIILDQEYKNIINNLSIGDIESDYEIVNLYRELMDVITESKLRDEDAKRFQNKYDAQQKNAIFNAISGVRAYGGDPWSFLGSLFVSGVSSYFGYREQKAQLRVGLDDNLWQLEKEEIRSFNDLQKNLLQASWALLRKYKLPDKYRITQENLNLLEFAMQETDKSRALGMFKRLENIFSAYPPFWFFYGDAATRSGNNELALKCFQKFDEAWRPVLRQDPFRVHVARYQITLEKDLTKERISQLLETINQFTSPTNWMDNLFVGVISYSIGEKEEAKKAVETNILFKSEVEISPLILKSMQSGNLNLSVLPGEIKAALSLNVGNTGHPLNPPISKIDTNEKTETDSNNKFSEERILSTFISTIGHLDDSEFNVVMRPKFYVKNYIKHYPAEKLHAAIASYAPNLVIENVLIHHDISLFGGAKEGFIMTKDSFYYRQHFSNPARFNLKDVVNFDGRDNFLGAVYFYTTEIEHTISIALSSVAHSAVRRALKNLFPSKD